MLKLSVRPGGASSGPSWPSDLQPTKGTMTVLVCLDVLTSPICDGSAGSAAIRQIQGQRSTPAMCIRFTSGIINPGLRLAAAELLHPPIELAPFLRPFIASSHLSAGKAHPAPASQPP